MADEALYNDQTTTEAEYARQLDAGRVQRQRSAAAAAQTGTEQAATAALESLASRAGVQGYAAVRIWKFIRQHKVMAALLILILIIDLFLITTIFLSVSYVYTHPLEAWKLGFQVVVSTFFPSFKP